MLIIFPSMTSGSFELCGREMTPCSLIGCICLVEACPHHDFCMISIQGGDRTGRPFRRFNMELWYFPGLPPGFNSSQLPQGTKQCNRDACKNTLKNTYFVDFPSQTFDPQVSRNAKSHRSRCFSSHCALVVLPHLHPHHHTSTIPSPVRLTSLDRLSQSFGHSHISRLQSE